MTSRETKRINGDCRGTVSSQHSADIKGSPEFFVECNWGTLDCNTRLFGERESLVGTVDVLRPVLRGS